MNTAGNQYAKISKLIFNISEVVKHCKIELKLITPGNEMAVSDGILEFPIFQYPILHKDKDKINLFRNHYRIFTLVMSLIGIVINVLIPMI